MKRKGGSSPKVSCSFFFFFFLLSSSFCVFPLPQFFGARTKRRKVFPVDVLVLKSP